jgi:hypothetical protein
VSTNNNKDASVTFDAINRSFEDDDNSEDDSVGTGVLQQGNLPSKPMHSLVKHNSAMKHPACPKGYNTCGKK